MAEKLIDLSPIKQERLKKQEKQLTKKQMRSELPILTLKEIRRYRLPYHEALLMDLNEGGFTNSAQFMRQLIDHQNEFYAFYSSITTTPQTLMTKEHFDDLFSCLMRAEKSQKYGNFAGEFDEFMKLGIKYTFFKTDTWWLGEQLLQQCLLIISFVDDNNERTSTVHYVYGKFLLEKLNNAEFAENNLNMAREYSKNTQWNLTKLFGEKQDSIYVETCILLHKIIFKKAQTMMNFDSFEAAKLAALARTRASEGCFAKGQFESLLLRGDCEILLKDSIAAIITFNKALRLIKKHPYLGIENEAKAQLKLATAYIQQKKIGEAFKILSDLIEFAENNEIPYYNGESYKYMAIFHLNQKEASKASPLLLNAFHIFEENDYADQKEEVRELIAIANGEEIFKKFIKIILNCYKDDRINTEVLMQLIRWKECREPFWENEMLLLENYEILEYVGTKVLETDEMTVSDIVNVNFIQNQISYFSADHTSSQIPSLISPVDTNSKTSELEDYLHQYL